MKHIQRVPYRPDTSDEDQDLWTADNMISDPHPGHTDSALIMLVIYLLSSPLLQDFASGCLLSSQWSDTD